MNYFKNKNNDIFAYDDEQVKNGCGKGFEAITIMQFDSFKLFGTFDKTQKEIDLKKDENKRLYSIKISNDEIISKITALEQKAIRPMLNGEQARVDTINAEIKTLRSKLVF